MDAKLTQTVVLASASAIRKRLLEAAGVKLDVRPAVIDEDLFRQSLQSEGASPAEMATALAELKARKVPGHGKLTIGCDQILEFEGKAHGKAADMAAARAFLLRMRGRSHRLHAAAVICENGRPVWRSVTAAQVTFRPFSDRYLDHYLQRGGRELLGSVGCYRIEEEGIRLVADLSGDIYAVYGLPMIPLLEYLAERGVLEG